MTLPNIRPLNEWVVTAKTASVGTTPAAAWCVAPVRGRVVRTYLPRVPACIRLRKLAAGLPRGRAGRASAFEGAGRSRERPVVREGRRLR